VDYLPFQLELEESNSWFCLARPGHGIDPRVLNYLDIDTTVDTSFPSDCSDSGYSSRSGKIFEPCSDDSLLRCLLLHFLRDCYYLYFRSCFAMRLLGPLPLISMMVSLSSGLSIFWDAILLLHFIVLHRIILNHYVGRTRGKACHFLYY
jgi:hypothetical protein